MSLRKYCQFSVLFLNKIRRYLNLRNRIWDKVCIVISLFSFQLLMSAAAPATTCCESGRPVASDPHPGQAVCCPPLDSRAALLHSARVSGLPTALYSSPYAAAAAEQGYVHFAADPSAFYSPLVSLLSFISYRMFRGMSFDAVFGFNF